MHVRRLPEQSDSAFAALSPNSGTLTECLIPFDIAAGWIGCTVGIRSRFFLSSDQCRNIGRQNSTCRLSECLDCHGYRLRDTFVRLPFLTNGQPPRYACPWLRHQGSDYVAGSPQRFVRLIACNAVSRFSKGAFFRCNLCRGFSVVVCTRIQKIGARYSSLLCVLGF